jgi:hypothetical protein
MFGNIGLQNGQVCSKMFLPNERSELGKTHYSQKPKVELNNDWFLTRALLCTYKLTICVTSLFNELTKKCCYSVHCGVI